MAMNTWDMHDEIESNTSDGAAKKYDLEGRFPASNAYRELVSILFKLHRLPEKKIRNSVWAEKSDEQSKEAILSLIETLHLYSNGEGPFAASLRNYQKGDRVGISRKPLMKTL
ncbi:hypothetical protein NC653_019777 [Populus alba x Populus x berolinensis]|uniref:Uncharacterized protein n=1 Tax=Populus alba x Populus x berolinensis TaxID=444605 RepID=A0AAD6VY44_9ROSI|nr:hypothetical protein NC653_019777 [Populus alba x Populus x berolinensis]